MPSRSDGDCSHFAPTRRPANAHRLKPTRRRGGLLIGEYQLVELLRLRLVELRHEVAVPVERGLDRAFYALHVWAWQDNPHGVFVDWNPRVSCTEHTAGGGR